MSIPTVVTVVQQHRAALLAREQATMQAAAQRWLGVETALNAQVDALALELANTGTPTWGQLTRSRRYAALRQQINAELGKYADYMDDTITRGQRNMAVMALEHSARAIDAVATEAGIVAQFDRISVAAVEDMIGLAGDGTPLRAILDDAARGAGDALGQQLVNGIALGKNPIDVARAAMRLGLGQSFTRMQAISRTEQLRVYRTSSLASYQASRVVIAYRRLSARDDRVCPGCLMSDGQQYAIEYGFDEHVQGRCTMIPVLANVAPVQFQTGQEWFAQQPEATQRAILGAGRYDAWKRGDASLSDMVSRDYDATWGGSLRATRVRDLRGGGSVLRGAGPVAPAKPLQPAGNPIGQAFDTSLRLPKESWRPQGGADTTPVVQEVTDRIAKVHGVGNLPTVGIEEMTESEKSFSGAVGSYSPKVVRGTFDKRPAWEGGGIDIDMQAEPLQRQATLTHEIGHYLDNKGIGTPGEFSSVSDPLFAEWRKAVDETKGIKTLRAYKLDPALAQSETGIPSLILPSDQAYDYLLDYRETWARSYMQYVAEKSNMPEMIAVYDSRTVRTQWDTDDFAPVMQAIDNLFVKLGWLK